MKNVTLVLVAHGSRDPRTLPTVHALLNHVRTLRPHLPVHLGHIELNAPLLPETLATLDARTTTCLLYTSDAADEEDSVDL
ncbi:sirohydrochlorin chelatase, partial [Streptomyces sp. NRRL F-6677]|uniref:sirohydrochlorin chelatase n=1 Tax=Streptomyces sp. NRRL F-6677 TaxID=1463879 RepID=UPI003B639259